MGTIRVEKIERDSDIYVLVTIDVRTSAGQTLYQFRILDQGDAGKNEKKGLADLRSHLEETLSDLRPLLE